MSITIYNNITLSERLGMNEPIKFIPDINHFYGHHEYNINIFCEDVISSVVSNPEIWPKLDPTTQGNPGL